LALVNRYLDLLLSVESSDFQRQFTEALACIDSESQKQFAKDFVALTIDDQVWLLSPLAYPSLPSLWVEQEETTDPRLKHFQRLKGLIAEAYYGSEIGQKELGWDGEFTHGPYPGCDHPPTEHT
jgi:Gluconate 2-dehydrogenase subunit 3